MKNDKPNIMIVESRYYEAIAGEILAGATEVLAAAGAHYEIYQVPGAFELPAAVSCAVLQQNLEGRNIYDGYIVLGCVIRGETTHYDYVCEESARGLMDLSTGYGLCIGYGILTVENEQQAWARASRGDKNKGGAAANACLDMIALKRRLESRQYE